MNTLVIVNKEKLQSNSIPAENVALMYYTSASDLYGYDEEKLDSMGYETYTKLVVFMLKDGSTEIYNADCEILFI